MVRVANSITELIGNTPIVKLNRLTDENSADVYLKLEYMNPKQCKRPYRFSHD